MLALSIGQCTVTSSPLLLIAYEIYIIIQEKKTKDLVEWYNLFITFHKRATLIIPETIFTICVTLTIKIGGKKKEDKCGMFGEVNRVVFF
jgi:hypothetical protein